MQLLLPVSVTVVSIVSNGDGGLGGGQVAGWEPHPSCKLKEKKNI